MENAAKALSIAGGLLIALLVIGVLLYMFQSTGEYNRTLQDQKLLEQITEFNREYESYQKTLMRGTDVVTVVNMANNNNVKRVYDSEGNIINLEAKITSYIKLKHEIKSGNTIIMDKNYEYKIGNYNKDKYNTAKDNNDDTKAYHDMFSNDETLKDFKRRFFKCTAIGYSKTTGMVNELKFEEVDIGETINY